MQKFRPILNLIIIWSLIALIFTAINYLSSRGEGRNSNPGIILLDNLFRFGVWGFLSPLIFWLSQRFDFQAKSYYIRDFSAHIFGAFIVTTIHFFCYGTMAWFAYIQYRDPTSGYWQFVQNTFLSFLYLGLLVYGLILFACQAIIRNRRFAKEQKKSADLQAQLVQAQLQALKMQLQPHFLFNALNSISALVVRDPVYAQTMISKLGDFLRLTLLSKENQFVRLSEELYFLQSYLEIEKVRFSDKLVVNIDVSDELLNAVVPHLILQPIVENSIKHGISNLTENGKIEIKAFRVNENLQIIVTDNGKANTVEKQSDDKKTGLANLRSRLQCLYGGKYKLELILSENNNIAEIEIPLSFGKENIVPND